MIKYLLFFTLISSAVAEVFRLPLLGWWLTLVDFFSTLTFFVWLLRFLLIDRKIIVPKWFIFLLFFLIIWAFSLILNITDLNFSFNESIGSLSYLIRYFLLVSLIFITFNLDQNDKLFIRNSIFFTSFIIVILGFLQLKFFPSFAKLGMNKIGWDPHIWRMLSTWFDPNYLGWYFAFVISLWIWVVYDEFELFRSKLKRNNIIFYFILILMIFLLIWIILTYSRSALIALIFSFFVCWLFLSKRVLFIFSIVLILFIWSSSRMQERFFSWIESAKSLFISSEKALDPTAKLRIKSWNTWIEIFKENPILWVWFNTLKYVQKKKWAIMNDSHWASWIDSSIITVLATTWIIWFCSFILFWFHILRSLLLNFFRKKDKYSIWLFAWICGLFIHSIFVNSLFFYAILPTLFISIWLMKNN